MNHKDHDATYYGIINDDIYRFIVGYLICALWASNDEDGCPLIDHFDINDIEPETMKQMRADCTKFCNDNRVLLKEACKFYEKVYKTPMQTAGHDFWLSRNGHGVGYFDRGDEEVWDKLQKIAEKWGKFNLDVADNEVYGFIG